MDPESEVISPVSFLMLVICVFCLFIRIPRDLLVVLFVFEELAFYFIDILYCYLFVVSLISTQIFIIFFF